jgi:hypothetical protein
VPIVNEVAFGKDRSIEEAPTLTAEELDTLKKKQEAFDKLLRDEAKAKYKIEVMFAHKRKLHDISAGALSIWESGAKLHGGGDTKIYWCPAKEQGTSDCNGVIPDASNGYGHLVCPKCGKVWTGEQVYGELMYKLPASKWALVLLKHYARLEHNADIYLKYPHEDLRVADSLEHAKDLGGVELEKVRKRRQQYIYPLANVIKDCNAGADLYTRFLAFLTA